MTIFIVSEVHRILKWNLIFYFSGFLKPNLLNILKLMWLKRIWYIISFTLILTNLIYKIISLLLKNNLKRINIKLKLKKKYFIITTMKDFFNVLLWNGILLLCKITNHQQIYESIDYNNYQLRIAQLDLIFTKLFVYFHN